jgi:Arm DNA-binding domain
MPLTDVSIRNAKAGTAIVKLSDGGGLQLWLMPTGSKLWRLAYRFEGKEKKLSIGTRAAITLSRAGALRQETKARLASGRAPSEQTFRPPLAACRCFA